MTDGGWGHEVDCGDGHEERPVLGRFRRFLATLAGTGGCAAVLGAGRGAVRCCRERGHHHDGTHHRAPSRLDPRARIAWDERGHVWLEPR